VAYTVVGGTATGGGVDYTLVADTLRFLPGSLAESLSVLIKDDALVEQDETIILRLSGARNATLLVDSTFTYTIIDNDGLGFMGPGGVGDSVQ
jgi:hypothetical protein